MSIIVKEITKLYGSQKALDSVSLEIKPGEIVGLLGPNGAGKSTLMKILTCFIPPTSGEATVCGFDIFEQSIDVRKRVGYLPENNPLYLDLYVKEFLTFMAGLREKFAVPSFHFAVKSEQRTTNNEQPEANSQKPVARSQKRITEIIDLTGLGSEQHKKLDALSKGYRQRVGLAQALLHDPEVLILDEPTSGLDPNQILEIRNLIRTIGKEKTVMLSTHILQEVEAICDRAIIIHKGRIVADNSTKNLQNIASERVIIRVEFDSEVEEDLLRTIPGVLEVISHGTPSPTPPQEGRGDQSHPVASLWHLVSSPEKDIRADIFKFAVDNGLVVLSLNREEQKLEEVFQELTKN